MVTRQNLLEIRRLFNEMLEEVVGNFVKKYPYMGNPSIGSLDREISFLISEGDMYFCKGKYHLLGDGEGSNPVLDQIYGRNTMHEAPTIISKIPHHSNCFYLLHLERTDTLSEGFSYFVRSLQTANFKLAIYVREEMLESEDFKNCILQMVKDIAPAWLYKFESLLA